MLQTWFAALVLLAASAPGLDMLRRGRRTPRLSALAPRVPPSDTTLPRVSVVVAARNEESSIEAAARSLIDQDYPDLEIVAVDDRSTDATGRILADLAGAYPERLKVVAVDELPGGWLGKNHALWLGARSASGDWLLFTDADVVFTPTCVRLAVSYAAEANLDHLTIGPEVRSRGFWLGAFVALFSHLLVLSLQLYRVNDPESGVGVGLGAFNLVRRSTYEAIGTHAAIALRPDDDVRLGLRVREHGFRQQLLDGSDLLRVEWYPSLSAAIHGLEKNFFAGFDYSLPRALASNAVFLAVVWWPWLGVWRGAGWTRRLSAAALAANLATFLGTRWSMSSHVDLPSLAYALVLPVTAPLVSYTALRSAAITLRQGGIRWRETFYPLAELSREGSR